MVLKIKQSGFIESKTMQLTDEGIVYRQSTALSAPKKKFKFSQVDYILLSPANTLAFGVGQEVFSIQTNSKDAKHKEFIDTFLSRVRATRKA